MNPRDFQTWTSFADHPAFADPRRNPSEWSSAPETYTRNFPTEFLPEWYIHVDPKMPTHVQAAIAERDIRNFREACARIQEAFGEIHYELFILDDLTTYVDVTNESFNIMLGGHDYGDGTEIVVVEIVEPMETMFYVDAISEIVPRMIQLLRKL